MVHTSQAPHAGFTPASDNPLPPLPSLSPVNVFCEGVAPLREPRLGVGPVREDDLLDTQDRPVDLDAVVKRDGKSHLQASQPDPPAFDYDAITTGHRSLLQERKGACDVSALVQDTHPAQLSFADLVSRQAPVPWDSAPKEQAMVHTSQAPHTASEDAASDSQCDHVA